MQVEKTPMVHVKLKMKIPPSQLMSGNVPLPSNWLDFLQIQYKHTHNSTTELIRIFGKDRQFKYLTLSARIRTCVCVQMNCTG